MSQSSAGGGGGGNSLTLAATLVGGTYPNVVLQYGLAGTPGSAAELGTLAFVCGNTGAGGNAIAITSATLPSFVFRTLADNREWDAFGFDTFAFSGVIPKSFWEASAVDVPTLSGSVTGATNATPIVIAATAHGMGAVGTILPVTIASVSGNTAANGFWSVLVVDANHFSLRGSVGNGSYTSGGTWTTNLTAPEIAIYHTSDYQGQTGYEANIIFSHTTDGTLNINDRVGGSVILLNSAGTTLTFGNGGNVTSIVAKASMMMGSGAAITLDKLSRVTVTNPAIEFGAGGPNLFAPASDSLSIATGADGTRAVAISIDATQNVTFHSGVVFNTTITVPGIILASTGTTYSIMRAGGRPNDNYQWYTDVPIFGFGVDNEWNLVQVINGVSVTALHFDASVNATFPANVTAASFTGTGTVAADTGWTANADGGSKTVSIPSNATLAAMQAALNVVAAGFGDAFVATAEKCKALEAALVTFKVPNA